MFSVPQNVQSILERLESGGHRAVLAGGCVRDLLLGRRPHDWDIATSARPEQVTALFRRTVPTGLRHGTVTVFLGGTRAEVTTFRSEGAYRDGRRPETVAFLPDLEGDLSRRDFTVNAMAMTREGEVIDLHGGREDLKNRLLRCVGEPEERFSEDALRMLRAFRFSAQLGFAVEERTEMAIRTCAPRTVVLSAERVRDEMEKILCSPRPERLERVVTYGLLARYIPPEIGLSGLERLGRLSKRAEARWAGLCALLEERKLLPDGCGAFLRSLRLSGAVIRSCTGGMELLPAAMKADGAGWKRLLADHPAEVVFAAAAGADALGKKGRLRALNRTLRSGECFSLGRLAVNGAALEALGYPRGPAVGAELRRLLDHVIFHPEDNRPELLLRLAAEQIKR